MKNITVTLSDPLNEFVDAEAAARGLGNPSDYFQALLREEVKRKAQAEVKEMIDEGLASGEPFEWNAQTLENLKQEVFKRHALRQQR